LNIFAMHFSKSLFIESLVLCFFCCFVLNQGVGEQHGACRGACQLGSTRIINEPVATDPSESNVTQPDIPIPEEGPGNQRSISNDTTINNNESGDIGAGNETIVDSGTGNETTGDVGTGNERTGDVGTGNEETGDVGTGNEETGDVDTGNEGTGDVDTGNEETGDMDTGDQRSGDMGTGCQVPRDLNTGDQGTGNTGAGNQGSKVLNTGNQGTGNEDAGNQETGNADTGNQGTGEETSANDEIENPQNPTSYGQMQQVGGEKHFNQVDEVNQRGLRRRLRRSLRYYPGSRFPFYYPGRNIVPYYYPGRNIVPYYYPGSNIVPYYYPGSSIPYYYPIRNVPYYPYSSQTCAICPSVVRYIPRIGESCRLIPRTCYTCPYYSCSRIRVF
jgi:hypothetical protein